MSTEFNLADIKPYLDIIGEFPNASEIIASAMDSIENVIDNYVPNHDSALEAEYAQNSVTLNNEMKLT